MDKKRFIDDKENDNIPLLNVDIDSEKAFMVYSIIATVLTVCTSKIVKVQWSRITCLCRSTCILSTSLFLTE